jgi:hypothetical protein
MDQWKLGERQYSIELSHYFWEALKTVTGLRRCPMLPVFGGLFSVRMSKEYQ